MDSPYIYTVLTNHEKRHAISISFYQLSLQFRKNESQPDTHIYLSRCPLSRNISNVSYVPNAAVRHRILEYSDSQQNYLRFRFRRFPPIEPRHHIKAEQTTLNRTIKKRRLARLFQAQ